tara:strand:- start:119 stop:289 length:171 start_codon:yes stop_codon:yes gene_type:complete
MINEEQWNEYRDVQDSGMFNMFSPRAREMTSLTKDEWIYILKNYNKLKKQYEGDES